MTRITILNGAGMGGRSSSRDNTLSAKEASQWPND